MVKHRQSAKWNTGTLCTSDLCTQAPEPGSKAVSLEAEVASKPFIKAFPVKPKDSLGPLASAVLVEAKAGPEPRTEAAPVKA